MANSKVILGFIAGASIGAIAAILFSPAKGTDTRQGIIDKTSDLGNSLKDFVVDFVKGGKNVAEENSDTSKFAENNGDSYNGAGMKLNTMG